MLTEFVESAEKKPRLLVSHEHIGRTTTRESSKPESNNRNHIYHANMHVMSIVAHCTKIKPKPRPLIKLVFEVWV